MSILFLIKPEKQRIKMLWERVSWNGAPRKGDDVKV